MFHPKFSLNNSVFDIRIILFVIAPKNLYFKRSRKNSAVRNPFAFGDDKGIGNGRGSGNIARIETIENVIFFGIIL